MQINQTPEAQNTPVLFYTLDFELGEPDEDLLQIVFMQLYKLCSTTKLDENKNKNLQLNTQIAQLELRLRYRSGITSYLNIERTHT